MKDSPPRECLFIVTSFPSTDIDNNGFLDQKDFDCMGRFDGMCNKSFGSLMDYWTLISLYRKYHNHPRRRWCKYRRHSALRATIIEGKGDCSPAKLAEFQHIMRSLWEELSDLADFDKVCIKKKKQQHREMRNWDFSTSFCLNEMLAADETNERTKTKRTLFWLSELWCKAESYNIAFQLRETHFKAPQGGFFRQFVFDINDEHVLSKHDLTHLSFSLSLLHHRIKDGMITTDEFKVSNRISLSINKNSY